MTLKSIFHFCFRTMGHRCIDHHLRSGRESTEIQIFKLNQGRSSPISDFGRLAFSPRFPSNIHERFRFELEYYLPICSSIGRRPPPSQNASASINPGVKLSSQHSSYAVMDPKYIHSTNVSAVLYCLKHSRRLSLDNSSFKTDLWEYTFQNINLPTSLSFNLALADPHQFSNLFA
ncbi:hypothetical protein BYT27DRAFT_6734058 [Phlegmacium glaucopus]|nr:hypothetical protein BYT27DRAFT_6734058 [Phlegmacium glaucopus]